MWLNYANKTFLPLANGKLQEPRTRTIFDGQNNKPKHNIIMTRKNGPRVQINSSLRKILYKILIYFQN